MIDIYTEKSDSKDWIFHNDLYFNLNTGNEEMSQKEIDLIQQVDAAKLTPGGEVVWRKRVPMAILYGNLLYICKLLKVNDALERLNRTRR